MAASDHSRAPEGTLEIGVIRRAHGLRGEVFVQLTSDRSERLDPGAVLRDATGGEFVVETSRVASNGRRIVKFDRLADRTAAERAANTTLYGEPIEDPDALWVHELIGSRVVETDGTDRGECVAVLSNPAADILELADGALVPVTFVVSHADGVITIDPPDGLFE